uniref:C3H1-type domain-containing protein n=1 Tax=Leersia perrieri TaxID=77586 RepID=A0A0D9V2X8_9ORYZ
MSDPFHPYAHAVTGEGAAAGRSSYEIDLIAARYGGGPLANISAASPAGARRSAEVLYHQPIMGSHSTVEQIEALYSSNTTVKRPRLESSLPIYPQRPGTKDCAFYMMTRTCKFGVSCKFDHPQWVPEGGIPNWKEAANLEESYPEREGEPDCPFFMKAGKCKFGSKCKFNHPKEKVNALASGKGNEKHLSADSSILPVRPSEPLCSFYAKTGKCKFRAKCKFNHPKDIEIPSSQNGSEDAATVEEERDIGVADDSVSVKTSTPVASAQEFNSKGLPIRPGEVDCPFYMKMGSCKFGSTCRFSHPERLVLNFPLVPPLDQTILPTPETMLLNTAANFMQSFNFHSAHIPVEPEPVTYPQRPGETVCDFYMKTGFCKFSDRCKFHHPIDRSAADQSVQLTLAGLPRREDAVVCAFYMKTGVCKFGLQCKFDHPPPEEAIAKVSMKGDE